MKKAIFNWSGGKDSAMALHKVLIEKEFDIKQLVTTVNEAHNRISMHGVRHELLIQQAKEIGIDLHEIYLPETPTMSDYDALMKKELNAFKEQGITHSIFGDIFLEDLRKYREDKLAEVNLKGHFPLWKRNTKDLMHEFIDSGFKTIVVCAKSELLGKEFSGRVIDADFIKDLPENVDPCGENGEFHTFIYDGPIFKNPINFTVGETVFRQYEAPKEKDDICFSNDTQKQAGFYFCDLLPA